MVRLLTHQDHDLFKKVNVFYVPIEFEIDKEDTFKAMVLKAMDKKKNLN